MPEATLTPFKACTACGQTWATREAFIEDPFIHLIGYQVNFRELKTGLFLFNHIQPECNGTLALEVDSFVDLYTGPIFRERQTGSPDCLGLCLNRSDLGPCPMKCECVFVREIIQIIRKRHDAGVMRSKG